MSVDPRAVVAAVDGLLGPEGRGAPLHAPDFSAAERAAVAAAIDEGWVSTASPAVGRFEAALAEACGAPFAVALSSGTAAIHLALLLAGCRPGDEVLLPALTFVGTANAAAQAGAVPHFCDSEAETGGLCPDALERRLDAVAVRRDGGLRNRETGRRIAALVVVHAFGHPARMEGLTAVARRWSLPLVEDAAQALGSRSGGRAPGAFGLAGALSFNGNKIVTTGGGGALLTADAGLAAEARHLSTTARRPHPWRFDHDRAGFNTRMPGLNASLGLAQLARLAGLVADKRRLAAAYRAAFAGLDGVAMLAEPAGAESNFWLNVLLLDEPDMALRDRIIEALLSAGYGARPVWTLLDRLPMHRAAPAAPLPVARALEARAICLPSSAVLGRRL